MITLYGFTGCPYCQQLKNLIEADNLDYTYKDITLPENQESYQQLVSLSNCDELPVITVGTQLLVPTTSFKSIPQAHELIKRLSVQ